jgi:hypothetical protein
MILSKTVNPISVNLVVLGRLMTKVENRNATRTCRRLAGHVSVLGWN